MDRWFKKEEDLNDYRGTMDLVSHPLAYPIISLVFGILILIFPRLLNFIVAIYLIIVGLMGLLSHFK